MAIIRVAKEVAINNTTVEKTPKLPRGALLKGSGGKQNRATGSTEIDNVSSMNVVHSNFVAGNIKHL